MIYNDAEAVGLQNEFPGRISRSGRFCEPYSETFTSSSREPVGLSFNPKKHPGSGDGTLMWGWGVQSLPRNGGLGGRSHANTKYFMRITRIVIIGAKTRHKWKGMKTIHEWIVFYIRNCIQKYQNPILCSTEITSSYGLFQKKKIEKSRGRNLFFSLRSWYKKMDTFQMHNYSEVSIMDEFYFGQKLCYAIPTWKFQQRCATVIY